MSLARNTERPSETSRGVSVTKPIAAAKVNRPFTVRLLLDLARRNAAGVISTDGYDAKGSRVEVRAGIIIRRRT